MLSENKLPIFSYFDNRVFQYMSWGCYVAGGAITSLVTGAPVNDIDVGFLNEHYYERFKSALLSKGYIVQLDTVNALHLQDPVSGEQYDLIKKPQEIWECLENIDFTICKGAVDNKNFYYDGSFFKDIALKRLSVNKVSNPLNSLFRMQKYIQRGYKVLPSTIVKLASAIHGTEDLIELINEFYVPKESLEQ